MIKYISGLMLFILLVGPALAQSLPAVKSIQEYWSEGETKEYPLTFADTAAVGLYQAEMVDVGEIKDIYQYEIAETYDIKFPGIFPGSQIGIDSRLKIDDFGYLRSAVVDVTVDGRSQRIDIEYDPAEDKVKASWGEGEQAGTREIETGGPVFACDNNMIAQLELMMAQNELIPKKSFVANAISLQRLYVTEFEFNVLKKMQIAYGAYVDSVWQVEVVRPVRQMLYVDKHHRIVKFRDYDIKITGVYKRDPFADKQADRETGIDFLTTHISRLPIYVIFLMVAALWVAMFSRAAFGELTSYLFFVIGCVAYGVIFVTQVPLHELYSMQVLYPVIKQGRSVVLYGIVPSIITAFIQQSLKLLPLLLLARINRPKPATLIALGAFLGAGFGFMEAAHVLGPLFQNKGLTTMVVIEKLFSTLFHTGCGVLIAYGIARYRTIRFWVMAMIFHFAVAYSLFFHRSISFGILHAWQIIISVVVFLAALYLNINFGRKLNKTRKTKR